MIETRINDLITQELKKTESVYELVKARHRNAPEGCLSISRGRGKPQFYHYKNGKKHYIKKDNYHLAEQLAQKSSEEYAGRAIRKIYQYEMSGFTVGNNFMYSMECAEQPLNIRAIRLQIERWWNAE